MLPNVFGGRCSLAFGCLVISFVTTNGFLLFAGGPKHKVTGSSARIRRDSGRADVVQFHVLSKVTSRYSQVLVTSVVQNRANAAREVNVNMKLPKAAFISNFSMEIEGRTYVGIVKEKEAAEAEYQHAVSTGQSAGLVKTKIRGTQTFDVSVNVEPNSQVTFRLNYEELLERKLGVYNHVIYADPGQTVEDFEIKVHINEQVGISLLEVTTPNEHGKRPDSPFDVGNSQDAKIRRTETQGFVTYKPTVIQQEQFRRGDHAFTVTYDVKREALGGSILIRNGYFVHFFAPEGMPVIPKDIVFVIDQSGSMFGSKMSHTKKAFTTILGDLKPHDRFNIITFSGRVDTWTNSEMMEVSPNSIKRAKKFVSRIRAAGSTNFYDALMAGIGLLETTTSHDRNTFERAGMVIALTDGRPTTGITNSEEIRRRVTERVRGRYSIFCLGFGEDLDHDFLNRLSKENQGISRRIYNDADAVIQLKGFYDEVASPMLAHVIMNYTGTDVAELSSTRFDNFFDGSEIMVVGRLMSGPTIRSSSEGLFPEPLPDMKCVIGGRSADGDVTLVGRGVVLGNSFVDPGFDMEKIWAYRTIKELLKNKTYVDGYDQEAIREIDDEVIRLSLKFNFVTDRTAMVVTKPGQEEGTLAGDGEQAPPPRPLPRVQNSPTAQRRVSSPRFSTYSARGYGFPSHSGVPNLRAGPYSGPVLTSSGARYGHSSVFMPTNRLFSGYARKQVHHPARKQHHRLRLLQMVFTTTTTTTPTTTTTTTTTTQVQTNTPTSTVAAPSPPTDPLSLTATCGEFLTVGIGEPTNITTPSYPDLYPLSSQCVWRFDKETSRENPMVLKLTFPKMDLEESSNCAYDRVLVYPDLDENISTPEVLSYCGIKSEPVTLTARQQIIVVFQSDDMVNGRGFVATVRLEEMAL